MNIVLLLLLFGFVLTINGQEVDSKQKQRALDNDNLYTEAPDLYTDAPDLYTYAPDLNLTAYERNRLPRVINDFCSNAIEITLNTKVTVDTTLATADNAPFCGTDITSPGIWYKVMGTGGFITASFCGSNTETDTKLTVYTGSCNDLMCVDGNDDACDQWSEVIWESRVFEEYYILAHAYEDSTGISYLDVTAPNRLPDPKMNLLDNSNCGDDIDEDSILVGNMDCTCSRSTNRNNRYSGCALGIKGKGIKLDLNGFSISCAGTWPYMPPMDPIHSYFNYSMNKCKENDYLTYLDESACINIMAESVTVTGGTIEYCNIGIKVDEDGAELSQLMISNTFREGIVVNSNSNNINGVKLDKIGNNFDQSTLEEKCLEERRHPRDDKKKQTPFDFGAFCRACDVDGVFSCWAKEYSSSGIKVGENSHYNMVSNSVLQNTALVGINVEGSHNIISDNVVKSNLYGSCISVSGSGNEVHTNVITECGFDGIVAFSLKHISPSTITATSTCIVENTGGCCHTISGNMIDNGIGFGIAVGTKRVQLNDNKISNMEGCILVYNSGMNAVAENNHISKNKCDMNFIPLSGYEIEGDFNIISNNVVTNMYPDTAAFFIRGNDNTLVKTAGYDTEGGLIDVGANNIIIGSF